MSEETVKTKRKKGPLFFWILTLLILVILLLLWWFLWRLEAYTDDAYVEGNQVYVTAWQSGFVKGIYTDDTYLVKQGQLLFDFDSTDTSIQYNQSSKKLAQVVREVCQMFHQAFAYQSEIEVKKAELIKAMQDYQHRNDVLDAEGVSLEDFEHSEAAYRTSYHSLKMTQKLYAKALAMIQGTSIKNHPMVLASASDVRNIWVQKFRDKIYSPVDGLVAQRTAQVGMWIESGTPLLSVIPLNQIWVNANFKETQLKHMRIGQSVRLTSDLYGREVVFHGKIVGLPGGAGNAFSLLPPQNLSGNWIKIVQRLPVRVELSPDEIKEHPLRLGLSMEAWVDLDQDGLLVPCTNHGPSYETTIFDQEEKGVEQAIEAIIKENLDPTLLQYYENIFIPDRSEEVAVFMDLLERPCI